LSETVLNQLLSNAWRVEISFDPLQEKKPGPFESTTPREVVISRIRENPPRAPNIQPLEPILFPKLRIYFADFLNRALSCLTRGCSPWRPDAVISTEMLEIFSPPDFQGPLNTHKRFQRAKSLSFAISQSQKNFIPGSIQILEGRENSFLGIYR